MTAEPDRSAGPPLSRRAGLARLALAAAAAVLPACSRSGPDADGMVTAFKGLDITGAPYGRRLALTDQHGLHRTLEDFKGKVVMLYFGFVQCPDVCPTALTRAAEVKRRLGDQGKRLQVLFVTVDPERDTPDLLRSYMAAFDPDFLALTGSAAEIKATADEFRAHYKKVPTGSSYTMDHSALSYLFDAQGRLRVALRHAQTADEYLADIRTLMAEPAA